MVSRRGLLGGAAIIGAAALSGVAAGARAATAAESGASPAPLGPVAVPHLIEADRMVQYQRLLAAGYLPDGLAGHWPLDGSGADRSGNERAVTLGAGASWSALRVAGELSFDGSSHAYAATASVLDTASPFTVSAWVRLSDGLERGADPGDPANGADMTNWYTAVSQDGAKCSRFLLHYSPDAGTWAFRVRDEDQTAKPTVVASLPAKPGLWTHLAGVWDGTKIHLYVDGVLQGSADAAISWAATRGFNIGRAWLDGAPVNRFKGSIADVRAYARALTGDEVALVSGLRGRSNNVYLVDETPSVVWGQPSQPAGWVAKARCSSFMTRVLTYTYPWATDSYFTTHFHDRGPEAEDYHDAFNAGAGPRFKKIRKVADLQPGDLIAIDYKGSVEGSTGHIVMVRDVKGVYTGSGNVSGETQYAVEIIDCSASPHGVYGAADYARFPDTRMVGVADGGDLEGVGIGHMMFYASNATGEFSRYRSSVNAGTTKTYGVAQRSVVAARIV
ncbi:LamG domain-containing protein [Streptomyces sp. NPDC059828]|uniref:LamG domain-containing protein n=1 Tax=Streptomyces sp. NPDC059828 TaxID=3346965 RepID=UPI00364F62DF